MLVGLKYTWMCSFSNFIHSFSSQKNNIITSEINNFYQPNSNLLGTYKLTLLSQSRKFFTFIKWHFLYKYTKPLTILDFVLLMLRRLQKFISTLSINYCGHLLLNANPFGLIFRFRLVIGLIFRFRLVKTKLSWSKLILIGRYLSDETDSF